MKTAKKQTRSTRGISPVISTIILTGTLLIILVIASYVSANLLELQVANTEFEQSKTNMLLLDEVIQDVALRPGSGGYVQFNQRSSGIGIYESPEKIKIKVFDLSKQINDPLELKPNSAGTFQEWSIYGGASTRWQATSDSNDNTGIQVTGAVTLKELQELQDTSQKEYASITSVTAYIKAKISGETLVYNTITFIGSTTATGNNPDSGDFTLPSGWQTGDVAIFWWYTNDYGKTFTPPNGVTTKYNTPLKDYGRLYIGYRILQSGDSRFGWSAGNKIDSTTIWGTSVFRNVDTTNIWDADYGTPIAFTGQNPDPPMVTTSTDKACVIVIFGKRDDYTSINPPSGYTSAGQGSSIDGDDASAGIAYKIKSPSGSENPSAWTLVGGASANGLVWTGALKPTSTNPEEKAVLLWRTHDTEYESSPIIISRTGFIEYSEERKSNPYTGQAWTWEEINALQIGVSATQLGSTETLQVSDFWVTIYYTDAPFEVIYDSGSLTNIVYRGGSKVTGADMYLRGDGSLIANMADALSYLRVETGEGVLIKLDYNRVRIIETGSLPIDGTTTEFIVVTFIRLERGSTSGSDTISVNVQNVGVNTATRVYEDGNIKIEVELENAEGIKSFDSQTFAADNSKIVVTFAEIVIRISTS